MSVPITIDYLTLGAALKAQMYTAPGGKAALWNGADQCQFLSAENPVFSSASSRLRLETAASLGLGVAVAGRCVSPITWSGIAEAESSPYIAPGLRLKIRIANLNLYNTAHQKTFIVGKGFDLIKQYLIPGLETFTYDLNPAIQQLGGTGRGGGYARRGPANPGRDQHGSRGAADPGARSRRQDNAGDYAAGYAGSCRLGNAG